MLASSTFEFLRDLNKNNNREWFQNNKSKYEAAQEDFLCFITALIAKIIEFDDSIADIEPKKTMFRIYRDVRFSKDKRPYKTNLGAHLAPKAAKPHSQAGYYIHVEPGNCFLAGGAYQPPASWLNRIRERIAHSGEDLKRILTHPDFKTYFGKLEGEQLKTKPRDYPVDHPHIDLLRYKSYLAMHPVDDLVVQQIDFLDYAKQVFQVMKPFKDFLNIE